MQTFYPEVESFTKNGDKIWLGKILANDIQFAKVFPLHNFAQYSTLDKIACLKIAFYKLKITSLSSL